MTQSVDDTGSSHPKVAVIIPTYNAAELLAGAVRGNPHAESFARSSDRDRLVFKRWDSGAGAKEGFTVVEIPQMSSTMVGRARWERTLLRMRRS